MIEKNKLSLLMFILSEGVFFIFLILAYAFYYRPADQGPASAHALDVVKSGIFSLALFSSSATLWRAEVNHKLQNRRRRVGFWILATLVLGTIFLIGQAAEYAHLLRQNITISRNLFGTTFFTVTAFHGFHVFIGLLLLAILLYITVSGKPQEPSRPAMDCVSIYWHFVDAVWIFIFAVVYLWRYA